eukprot:s5634_g1.t1
MDTYYVGNHHGSDEVLDFFLVVAQLVEEALILANKETSGVVDFAVLRIVRTLRFMRIIRVLRLTRFFDDLRRLVACMLYSAKSFIWTPCSRVKSVMFVFLLVYIYGLYLTQSVHLHRLEKGPEGQGDAMLDKFFGTVGRSILSLFQALTGGIDWRELVDVLSLGCRSENMHEVWGLATVFWIAFLILGVMNIITGNFVSAAMERSQSDLDNVFQARRLFKSLDIDDSGAITIDEIRRHLESKPVQQTIDVDSSEAEVLFEILDLSGDGSIDKEDFISGCLRLQGTARAVDLLLMTKDAGLWSTIL